MYCSQEMPHLGGTNFRMKAVHTPRYQDQDLQGKHTLAAAVLLVMPADR